tara:strand:+ start:2167 stop:2370 length:204 start_codon:yes stop_codon:yes gene_type:complete
MFYASLLFCWVALDGQQCLIAQDTNGPYVEEEQCLERLKEMVFTIHSDLPFSRVVDKQCVQQKEGNV